MAMARALRLLDVQVFARGEGWESQLLDQAGLVLSGQQPSRKEAQRADYDALFERLLAGDTKPFGEDSR